ncbi:MAG: crotonase/enoyl-CoA hydratase family protein [Burkholderiaceae bacterium]|nr:crotonase/enoyl-CoA hydratase family protein [Burkholderiaceae bacterium]
MNEVQVTIENGISVIAINRPEARNAVDLAVARGIAQAVDEIDARDDIRVGVLTGVGGGFCAGMDLKAFLRGEVGRIEGRGFAGFTERPPAKPMIAAVEGYALAGGLELALACDLIVASRTSRLGLPEVRRGLVANAGGLVRLPRQMPVRIAMELVLTGEPMAPETLAGFGLINRVVEPGQALDAALEMARTIAGNAPMAVRVSKEVVTRSGDWPSTEMFRLQRDITAPVFVSADAREGALAFAQKRAPAWSGR